MSEDGKLKTYSDAALQKILAIREDQITNKILGDLKPLIDFYSTEQQSRQQQSWRAMAQDELKNARTFPHFEENEELIAKKLSEMDSSVRERIGPVAAMYVAYNHVMKEKVLPGYDQRAEQKVLGDFQRKANAERGAVVPTDQTSAGGSKPVLRNQQDLAKHLKHLYDTANTT